MFTFFRNCQIQSERTQAANAAREEALPIEGESSYKQDLLPWFADRSSANLTHLPLGG